MFYREIKIPASEKEDEEEEKREDCLQRGEEDATVRGRDWYKRLDAPVPTLDVTI